MNGTGQDHPNRPGIQYREDDHDALSWDERKDFIQSSMAEATLDTTLDTLLILANVWGYRADMSDPNSEQHQWCIMMATRTRELLEEATTFSETAPRPNTVYEDPLLYMDEPPIQH